MKKSRMAVLQSVLSILLSISLLVGTTFAWFTQSVTSDRNIIQSGNIDLEMYWAGDPVSGPWYNVEDDAYNTIFSYDNWEPGYSEIKYIKLVNKGNLALNYEITLTPEGNVGKLAEVIGVRFVKSGEKISTREEFEKLSFIGLLKNVMNGGATASGTLLPNGEQSLTHPSGETIVTIGLQMLTTAGNEYQNQSVGDGFSITALASQCAYESDSFGSDYDQQGTFDEVLRPTAGSVTVVPENGKVPAGGAVIDAGAVTATIPEGTVLADGEDTLSLRITPLESTTSDITVVNDEILIPVDVHVDGISDTNDVPLIINLGPIMPKYLNIGNYTLIHVENGINNIMTLVDDVAALNAHNQFTYNPVTGDVTVAMASFSEVAIVAETNAAWKGGEDYSWYDDKVSPYEIANADQLYAFAKLVGGMATDRKLVDSEGETVERKRELDNFEGETVKLLSDINLNNGTLVNNGIKKIFYPIGYYNNTGYYDRESKKDEQNPGVEGMNDVQSSVSSFSGTFDGNGHTISNIYQNTWEMFGDYNSGYTGTPNYYKDAMGLFGYVHGGTVKNLTVNNFQSDGEFTPTGVIAAYAAGDSNFENIAITNCNPRVYNTGNGGIIGIAGDTSVANDDHITLKNITVDNSNKISALWGSWDVACGGLVGMYRGNVDANGVATEDTISFENCHVAAQIDVYNDVCANYQYYAYRYAGMIIGSVRHNTTNAEGKTIPNMTGVSASGCTVNYGDWNDYYYCEFEENTMASYSEDYQFSRVPNDEIDTSAGKENAKCNGHDHTPAEDKQAVYLPFHQLFTGYSWGVSSIGLEKYSGIFTNLDITEGDQQESVEKFVKVDREKYENRIDYKIGELFSAKGNVVIKNDKVQVFVSPVGDESTVKGEYKANTSDWKQGTLTLSGVGKATITITDYNFCTPTVINVTVEERVSDNKFEVVFPNTDKYTYRVGNLNAVSLSSLFESKGSIDIGKVSVTVEALDGTLASGTYTANATNWKNGTIKFEKTGFVKVTIADDDSYCLPTELKLEVVDAVNATTATSASENNVVLLNDIGSGFTVSGRYTVYGNGFTLNYTGNGQYLNNGLKQGIVTVSDNGTIDNLRIKASIYPEAYMYYGSAVLGKPVQKGPSSVEGDKTRYHYQLSAVAASGNATISNCYIYGGRNNIFVNTGDVTVKNTVLESGTVANVQIQSNSSHTVTFENVTTIQYQVKPTIGDTSKTMLGAGIIVGPETTGNPEISLNGYFKQYNWVTEDDYKAVSDEAAEKIIEAALEATEYNHTINGKTASNLGIIYMNDEEANVINNTRLPYALGKISISGVTGQVYSLKSATADNIYSDYENADKNTANGDYAPQFKYSEYLGGQYIEKTDDGDEFCYREGDTIYVLFPSGDTKDLDLAKLVNIERYTGEDLKLEITCKDENGKVVTLTDNKVTLSEAKRYVVTYTALAKYSWEVTVSVSLKDTAVPDARFEFDATKQKMGYYKPSFGDVKQYLPFLAGLKIYDYNGKEEYLRFDGSEDFAKVASITITGYASNKASVEVKLTDGGAINTQFLARANSGGASTYTGKIKTSNNTIYFVNDGGTSNKDSTTTAAYWYVDYYKFTGNNGVAIQSGQQTFNSTDSSASTPSGNFSTTIKYTVTYNANDGNCGQNVGYATSVSAAVTLPTPTRSGFIFAGWYTSASDGTRVGGAGDSYTPSANITLYAQWSKPCTVTYNANGGSCTTTSEKYSGTALTLPTPTRDGYWFVGWYDAAEGGNKIGDAGAIYNPAGEITLYAHWQEKVEYTVTYNANGGTCGTASATYQGTALTLPSPTRTGYTFNGWYTAAFDGTKVGDAGASYIPSANITLYAQWNINSYRITVNATKATVSGVSDGQAANYGDTITFTVTYDGDSNKSTTVTDENGNAVDTTGSYTFTMPASNVTITASSSSSCITPDTLITLADGSQVRVDSLTGEEELLVWNLETGKYDTAPIVFVDSESEEEYEIIHLYFSDGSDVKVIYEHGFFDLDLAKYVYIDAHNYADYIGHRFVTEGDIAANNWNISTLDNVVIEKEVTTAWSPVTFEHLCYYTNGVLSMPGGIAGLFNIFDVDTETMSYDAEKMQNDIATYGLFTLEDFGGMIPEIAFEAFNGDFLKVAIAKGLLTWEDIAYMAERYIPLM